MQVTVLTPTFNRAGCLERLWASLCAQTFGDFEWLVVDDGSTDETTALIDRLTAESQFLVRYLRQDNQGKHIALNAGVRAARGEFTAVIDADDWYEPPALARLVEEWGAIDHPERFVEVQALCADQHGKLIGDRFPGEGRLDSDAFEIAFRYRVQGDKVGMQRTEVLRQYPFPETFRGVYVTEALIWFRIAERYRTRYINEILGAKQYLPGGLPDNERRGALERAGPRREYFMEIAQARRPLSRDQRWKAHVNWARNAALSGVSLRGEAATARRRALFAAAVPLGVALSLRDRWYVTRAGRTG